MEAEFGTVRGTWLEIDLQFEDLWVAEIWSIWEGMKEINQFFGLGLNFVTVIILYHFEGADNSFSGNETRLESKHWGRENWNLVAWMKD